MKERGASRCFAGAARDFGPFRGRPGDGLPGTAFAGTAFGDGRPSGTDGISPNVVTCSDQSAYDYRQWC
jgi:hypothetical protein